MSPDIPAQSKENGMDTESDHQMNDPDLKCVLNPLCRPENPEELQNQECKTKNAIEPDKPFKQVYAVIEDLCLLPAFQQRVRTVLLLVETDLP